MNIAETTGGSSRKGQENGDASNESERPLKKARFAWQVKGKYHLKNESNDAQKTTKTSPPTSTPVVAEASGSGSSQNNRDSEQNLEMLGSYLRKQDFKSIDNVITVPKKTPFHTITESAKVSYPRYVKTADGSGVHNIRLCQTSCGNNYIVPLSMAERTLTEDQCISRWQTKQMVKAFVDNTINRVLDLWIQSPLPPEEDHSRSIALDVADFINNLPGDNTVENAGILMAISAHGLQQPTSPSSSSNDDETVNNAPNQVDVIQPPTPQHSDDESHEPVNNNNQCDTDTSSNDLDMVWSYTDDHKNESNDMTSSPLFPEASNSSYQDANDSLQNSSAECDGNDNTNDNHGDLLDEAVRFAIQSKGLTTFDSEYG